MKFCASAHNEKQNFITIFEYSIYILYNEQRTAAFVYNSLLSSFSQTIYLCYLLLPMTKFSLVIPYRNRDTQIAKRCIDSLQAQSIFEAINYSEIEVEIVLVDYGSDLEKSEELEKFCQDKEHVTYIYTETRGKFWCKPEALNLALNRVRGDYFVTIDVDMIYLPTFLEQISSYVDEDILLHYQCYYLPEKFDYSNYSNNLSQIDTTNFEISDKTCALGIFIVKTSVLKEVGGFDEYYRMWVV